MDKKDLEIIKNPEAQRMLGIIQGDFYDRSYIGQWLFEVIGREYSEMRTWSKELRLEAFPETCTWGIPIWEAVYGIESDNTKPLECRRQQILLKRLRRPPINPARMEEIVSALTGCPVQITENTEPYTFRIDVDESAGISAPYQSVEEVLRQIKPSHLAMNIWFNTYKTFSTKDYSAGAYASLAVEEFVFED
ncbi:YmfQ family protein [Lachnospiraceae bacterium ZAX-1]